MYVSASRILCIAYAQEQFLHDGDVCNLGSLNLEKFCTGERYDYNDGVGKRHGVDVKLLKRVTTIATRMLDNVIDLSEYPVDRVNETRLANRRIGISVMGFADMLLQLRVPYNSGEGRGIAEMVMGFIQQAGHDASAQLAREKGVFPAWPQSVYYERGEVRRNAAITTVAPTGTISMMYNVSGGLEPYFALAYYYKNILGGATQLQYVNKHLQEMLEEAGVYSDQLMHDIIMRGSLADFKQIPKQLREVFVTAMDITAKDHILMQAAFQKQCDNSISKTINFPNDATREDCAQGFYMAWKAGCKGCTVYRDGSRLLQVLNLNTAKTEDEAEVIISPRNSKSGCPDCTAPLVSSEGCSNCIMCGYSACEKI